MKLGLVVYATKNGLGYQTKAYYDYLKPDKVMLVDISKLNGMPVYDDWYNFDIRTDGFPTDDDCDSFLDGLDAILVAETPLNYYLLKEANRCGVVSVLASNPEFTDYFQNPRLPKPTVIALPSLWLVNKFNPQLFPNVVHLPVPVDRSILPKRNIKRADTFFHIAGRPAIHDRNGTLDFIRAVKLVQDKIKAQYIIYTQVLTDDIREAIKGTDIHIAQADEPSDLYKDGDVLILPRKYGGLCLPANEAIGSGIPVIMTDISPNNQWLPPEFLVKVSGKFTFNTRLPIDAYTVDVNQLADKMIVMHSSPSVVRDMAVKARQMGEMMDWRKQKIRYQTLISKLCTSVSSAQ